MKPETRLVSGSGDDVAPPLARTTTFDRAAGGPYVYQRNASPTVEEAERVLGELDGGHALLYPSGTAVLLRPLEHGADVVVHSATKYLSGHSDVLAGVAVARDEAVRDRLLEFRTRTGIVAAPDVAWLLLRGLRTLPLRVARQSETALEIARRLERHASVERVLYPGLGDPVAARYMTSFGGLLSFLVAGGREEAERVEQSTRLIR